MNGVCRSAGLLALLAFAALLARAQEGPVVTRLEARKVVSAPGGRESFGPADAARPGDVIEYVATYRNTGQEPVRSLEATLPIPAHTELIAGSARPASARASTDSHSFAAPPLRRRASRDGRVVDEEVPYSEYRYLRWSVAELPPQQAVTFTARVRVVGAAAR